MCSFVIKFGSSDVTLIFDVIMTNIGFVFDVTLFLLMTCYLCTLDFLCTI